MSDPLFASLERDIDKLEKVVDFYTQIEALNDVDLSLERDESCKDVVQVLGGLQELLASSAGGFPLARGALFIQALARFEGFVRLEIENLALKASNNAGKYRFLPRDMREALQRFSALVIESPAKYRMRSQIESIVCTLSKNFDGSDSPGEINYRCLSITHENMRSSTIQELFGRLGVKDIWRRLGQSPQLQVYLEQTDAAQVSNTCSAKLNKFVDRRNSFTHSADSVTWPSDAEVKELFSFLREVGRAISQLIPVAELDLKKISEDLQKQDATEVPEEA